MTAAEELLLVEEAIRQALVSQRLMIGNSSAGREVERVKYADLCKRADQLRNQIASESGGSSMASLAECGRVI